MLLGTVGPQHKAYAAAMGLLGAIQVNPCPAPHFSTLANLLFNSF